MLFRYTLKTAFTGLERNRSRSALTILGIVIGIAAIILISSLGEGAQNLILGEIAGLGGETMVLRPGRQPKGPTDFVDTLFPDSITDRDIEALRRKSNAPDIVDIAPAVFLAANVSYRGETYRPQIYGMPVEFFANTFNLAVSEGRLYGGSEIRARSNTAVIGDEVRRELFQDDEAIGKTVRGKNQPFRVIGVFAPAGQVALFNFDKVMFVPQSTAQKNLLGISHYNEFIIKASSAEAVDNTIRDIERTIRELHRIEDPEDEDFHVDSQQAAVEQIKTITGALTVFLASVVAIALVVG